MSNELKKPKVRGRDIEQLKLYKKQLANKGNLKELFLELLKTRTALTGKIIFRRGKINNFYLFPYMRNGFRTLVMGIVDTNRILVKPTEKYQIEQPIKVKSKTELM